MFCFNTPILKVAILLALIPRILGAPFADALIEREAISSPLKARQAPFQSIIVATATVFGEETDGAWQLIDADGDGIADLAFIKTSGTASGTVEVFIASASSNFQTLIVATGTTFAEETDGTWLLVPSGGASTLPDLAFIKTSNTGTGSTEVHIASGASGYQARIIESGSTYAEETDGTWSLLDFDGDGILDLIFIKTSNTGTTVEVFVASGASGYQEFIFEHASDFGEETDGFWSLVPYISNADLSFIKTSDTGTGTTEVHIASLESDYATRVVDTGSAFGEETDGTWSLVDFDSNGVLDLVFIKTQNTPTGLVEVHIASG